MSGHAQEADGKGVTPSWGTLRPPICISFLTLSRCTSPREYVLHEGSSLSGSDGKTEELALARLHDTSQVYVPRPFRKGAVL